MNAAEQKKISETIAKIVRDHEASSQIRRDTAERARIETHDFLSRVSDCIQNIIRPTLTAISENEILRSSEMVNAAASQTEANGLRLAVTGDTKDGYIAFDPIAERQRIRIRTSVRIKRGNEAATENDEFIPIESATESYVATRTVETIYAILKNET